MRNHSVKDIVTYKYRDEICDVMVKGVIDSAFKSVVGVVTDCDLAYTVFQELSKLIGTLVEYADFSKDGEYVVTYDPTGGFITASPIEDCDVWEDIEFAYVDMDGSVPQDVVDALTRYADVVLFGEDDEAYKDCRDCDEESCPVREYCDDEDDECGSDEDSHGFSVTISDKDGGSSHISYYGTEPLVLKDVERLLGKFGVFGHV